jgi:N-acetylneuraminic acid mutarotase
MVVFGGFIEGERENDIWMYHFKENKWEKVEVKGQEPCPRAGHSMVVHDGQMFVFGGKDDDNNKINDLWIFDIKEKYWTRIESESAPMVIKSFKFNSHVLGILLACSRTIWWSSVEFLKSQKNLMTCISSMLELANG